ncbi:MAG TPA: recombination regulator RecX [Usitatibacter sp.]|nr:recombination regulator RecX [Usitatibacter sp.]
MAWAFILAKTEPISLKARAMRLLARREHSRHELSRKLERIAGDDEDVTVVLDELSAKGWLSDARFAEQSVRAKARRYGPLKVAHELRAKGVDDEAIAAAFRAAGSDGAANIESVWRTRFKAAPGDDRERARQVRFLQGRGFALDAVLRFFREVSR